MQFQKQWRCAYTCVCCSLRSSKRSFISSPKCSTSAAASLQPAGSSRFVNSFFQSAPSSPAIPEGHVFGDNGSPSLSQASKKGEHDTAEQRPQPAVQIRKKQSIGALERVTDKPFRIRKHLSIGALEKATMKSFQIRKCPSSGALERVTNQLFQAFEPSTSLEEASKQILQQLTHPQERNIILKLRKIFSGRTIEVVRRDLNLVLKLNQKTHLFDTPAEKGASEEGSVPKPAEIMQELRSSADVSSAKLKVGRIQSEKLRGSEAGAAQVETTSKKTVSRKRGVVASTTSKKTPKLKSTIDAKALSISPLPRIGPNVPNLCHDLSRVLFNPGIYQLQDQRSRVYNFDPYLEKLMPVSEFDFKVLKEYITSSADEILRSLALKHGKKYVGSSSSMTSVLAQFHFLLSAWRDINTDALSRGFSDKSNSFTILQRLPSSVFLRYQDGVYAMDADKEYDSANILMSLGKSMEKLLTRKPQDFERYRKTSKAKIPDEELCAPEAYQYSHAGDFLMRAQLDAHDSRLPGTGTFDLKTRAVVSIRHNPRQHEEGWGYQIKTRYGDWESYEREYYDMMRAAFLKYSLQVRLGQMDGIFVAFHNIERIFGFQYISLPEMDLALHGQYDTTLGDLEFKFSLELLNRILNRVTERFPKRSLRIHFDTRGSYVGGTFMQIFAEPLDEATIDAIQNSKKEAVDAFERSLLKPEMCPQPQATDDLDALNEQHKICSDIEGGFPTPSVLAEPKECVTSVFGPTLNEQLVCNDAPRNEADVLSCDVQPCSDKAFENTPTAENVKAPEISKSSNELMGLTLRIENTVNGKMVQRPTLLTTSDDWSLQYDLEEEMSEPLAQAQFHAAKARRGAAFQEREQNPEANYYLKRLRKLANRGAEWRKAQDELDAGRKRVVLYDDQ